VVFTDNMGIYSVDFSNPTMEILINIHK